MATREETLEMAHLDKSYMTPPNVNYTTVYKAMDMWAKQECAAKDAEIERLHILIDGLNKIIDKKLSQ